MPMLQRAPMLRTRVLGIILREAHPWKALVRHSSGSTHVRRGNLSPSHTQVGAWLETDRIFTTAQVLEFGHLSGDVNRIHSDAVFAATTPFKAPIVHGILVASLFSFLMSFDGAIYLKQSLEFRAPVLVGALVTARVQVIEARSRSIGMFVTCETTCRTADGEVAVSGIATVIFPTANA